MESWVVGILAITVPLAVAGLASLVKQAAKIQLLEQEIHSLKTEVHALTSGHNDMRVAMARIETSLSGIGDALAEIRNMVAKRTRSTE